MVNINIINGKAIEINTNSRKEEEYQEFADYIEECTAEDFNVSTRKINRFYNDLDEEKIHKILEASFEAMNNDQIYNLYHNKCNETSVIRRETVYYYEKMKSDLKEKIDNAHFIENKDEGMSYPYRDFSIHMSENMQNLVDEIKQELAQERAEWFSFKRDYENDYYRYRDN